MEYFLILPDSKVSKPLKFTAKEKQFLDKKPFVVNIGKLSDMVVVDIILMKFLFNSYFLLSEGLEKIFQTYVENIDTTPILITDDKYKLNLVYYVVDIEATKDVVANKFLKLHDMQIREELVKGIPIHKIYYEKQTYILVNRYVVESILRRFPAGIQFQEVKAI